MSLRLGSLPASNAGRPPSGSGGGRAPAVPAVPPTPAGFPAGLPVVPAAGAGGATAVPAAPTGISVPAPVGARPAAPTGPDPPLTAATPPPPMVPGMFTVGVNRAGSPGPQAAADSSKHASQGALRVTRASANLRDIHGSLILVRLLAVVEHRQISRSAGSRCARMPRHNRIWRNQPPRVRTLAPRKQVNPRELRPPRWRARRLSSCALHARHPS
jgi:hypothetical protein